MQTQKVLIVGGGIGGLTSAIALRRRGIEVDLVEINPTWTVYGVGIIIQSNVLRAFGEIGMLEPILAAGFAFDRVRIDTAGGQQLAEIPSPRLAGPQFPANIGVSRLTLHQILSGEAERLGARLKLGTTVEALDQRADGVDVGLSDGANGRYDLVIGADGIHSQIRRTVFGENLTPEALGQAVWRYNFVRRPEVDCLRASHSPGFAAGLCPLSDELMYMYLTSAERPDARPARADLPRMMRERLASFGGLIAELSEEITDPDGVVYKPLQAILVPPPWHRGRVVLLGDAAHATTPHLGQGAGMAIEDAVVLAEELARPGETGERLEAFAARRWPRCEATFESSLRICRHEIAGDREFDQPGIVRALAMKLAEPA